MSHVLNIDELSKEDLLALKEEINHRLKGVSFWDTVDALNAIDNQISKLRLKKEKIERSCEQLKKLKELGFSLVVFEEKRVGFINYSIEKIDNKYYAFNMQGDEIFNSSKNSQVLCDEDIKAIEKIFSLKVRQS